MTTDPVICPTCDRALDGTGCNPNHAYLYATEPWANDPDIDQADTCRSCGVRRHEPHHVPGCVVATCRTCDDQATFCDHLP
jgi:hypothetical protein